MKKLLLALIMISAVVLVACGGEPLPKANPEVHNLAQCLTENDVAMYGADWCPHCQEQKRIFGDAFEKVTYVECERNPSACNAAGVQSYPTWIINGQSHTGVQQLTRLAELSGCSLAP